MIRDEFTDLQILEAYQQTRNVSEAAEKLGVNRVTMWRWLKALKVKTPKAPPRPSVTSNYGAFPNWLRTYNKPLPRSLKQIVDLSGCPYETVKCYLYRQRRALKQRAVKFVHEYMRTHSTWPDGTEISGDEDFTVEANLYDHEVTVKVPNVRPFAIGVKPPKGYKRKIKETTE
jgi:transposase-like protein